MISMPWLFQPRCLPTSELYGVAARFPRIRQRCRMGESFDAGPSVVAVRCAPPAPGGKPVHLLLDDDMDALIDDPSLPAGYRQRIHDAWRSCVLHTQPSRIRSVIVPSARLEQIYRHAGFPVVRIDPSWPLPPAVPVDGFADGRLQVAFLGTRSHLADLDLLREAICDRNRTWDFHHFLGSHAPVWLAGQDGVRAHRPLPWQRYQKRLARHRFHLCLYPARDTEVNRARSCSKLMEHSMTGAAALYSRSVPFAGLVEPISPGLLVTDSDWPAAVAAMDGDRERCAASARSCHRHAVDLAAAARARQDTIWASVAADG